MTYFTAIVVRNTIMMVAFTSFAAGIVVGVLLVGSILWVIP